MSLKRQHYQHKKHNNRLIGHYIRQHRLSVFINYNKWHNLINKLVLLKYPKLDQKS